jgi:hypothetical protein
MVRWEGQRSLHRRLDLHLATIWRLTVVVLLKVREQRQVIGLRRQDLTDVPDQPPIQGELLVRECLAETLNDCEHLFNRFGNRDRAARLEI